MLCPSCGHGNVGGKFCGECGASLAAAGATPAPSPASPRRSEADRRLLSLMFCDLVGSTALSGKLDPEDLRELVREYQHAAGAVVDRYDGHVAQYLGDGILIYFGFPRAHEDDATRAVRSGLEIIAAMDHLNDSLEPRFGVRVAVRIGIHTGQVVVGDIGGLGRTEQLALGEAPNVAARVQGLADPGALLISDDTRRLVGARFDLIDLGPQELKGVLQPLRVHQVIRARHVTEGTEAERKALGAFVGRDAELAELDAAWDEALSGHLSEAHLVSEPGMGKSRLVIALRDQVAKKGGGQLVARCSPYHHASSLYPMVQLLERLLTFQPAEATADRHARLKALLASGTGSTDADLAVLAGLLSIPHPGEHAAPTRAKATEALANIVLAAATRQPLLFVVEDLHWADPSTLDLLAQLVERGRDLPILAVFTYRPGFTPPWSADTTRRAARVLSLGRLDAGSAAVLATTVAGGKILPVAVLSHVLSRAEGNPLFIEETVKMLLESGLLRENGERLVLTGSLADATVPTTLQGLLVARLDQLGAARETAQLGATLGRDWPVDLLLAVSDAPEPVVRAHLAQLTGTGLLGERRDGAVATFTFRHALIQDAAYGSMLKGRRAEYHERIGRALEERFPDIVARQPEIVGRHFAKAGAPARAVPYLQRAGEEAMSRSAFREAAEHLERALKQLVRLPPLPTRDEQELMLQTSLGVAHMNTKGMAATEVERAFGRAYTLQRDLGDSPQLFAVLRGLWEFYEASGDLWTAKDLGDKLLAIAEARNESDLLVVAHNVLGDTLALGGDFVRSLEHFEQALTYHDREIHAGLAFQYGYDPGVACLVLSSWNLWHLGQADAAERRVNEALELARSLAQPYTEVVALMMAAFQEQFRRDPALVLARTDAVLALSAEHGYEQWLALAAVLRGWAVAQSLPAEGLAQLRGGLDAWRATGAGAMVAYSQTLLAEVLGRSGHVEEALDLVVEAQAGIAKTGERYYEAEIHRLHGELLALRGDRVGAKAAHELALSSARALGALTLELRATVSLADVLRHDTDVPLMRARIAELRGRFSEGFQTADLLAADRALAT